MNKQINETIQDKQNHKSPQSTRQKKPRNTYDGKVNLVEIIYNQVSQLQPMISILTNRNCGKVTLPTSDVPLFKSMPV